MTLDNKIEYHFKNLKLEPKEYPEHSNHIIADYIELVTLFNRDSIITENEILDRFNDYNENQRHANRKKQDIYYAFIIF